MAQLTRELLGQMDREIQAALQPIAKKYGVVITAGGGSFTPTNATTKLKIATLGDDGVANTPEREAFERYASFHGFSKSLGDQVFYAGETWTLEGYRPKAKKFPILAKRASDGEIRCLPLIVAKGNRH